MRFSPDPLDSRSLTGWGNYVTRYFSPSNHLLLTLLPPHPATRPGNFPGISEFVTRGWLRHVTTHQAYFLLVDLALILLATRLAGTLAERLRQPRVIGEMAAGILLGPTLFHGALSKTLFPADTRPLLSALANLGVAVFMFLVGLELDHRTVRGNSTAALTTSIGAIVLPFGIGFGIAFVLREPDSSMPGFALYIGTALSITAFPVLARILRDRELHRTSIGGLTLTCAALADLAAWTILAGVVATLGASQHQWRLLLVMPYLLVMLFVV